jgi:hypothetical protein
MYDRKNDNGFSASTSDFSCQCHSTITAYSSSSYSYRHKKDEREKLRSNEKSNAFRDAGERFMKK